MGTIKLKDIRTYSYHGCLLEEGKIGSDYVVNLEIKANLNRSAKSDDLADTIDYVKLNRVVEEEMAIRSKLLESVTKRIIDRVLKTEKRVDWVKISVSKVNPPIGGDVGAVTVEMEKKRSFFKK